MSLFSEHTRTYFPFTALEAGCMRGGGGNMDIKRSRIWRDVFFLRRKRKCQQTDNKPVVTSTRRHISQGGCRLFNCALSATALAALNTSFRINPLSITYFMVQGLPWKVLSCSKEFTSFYLAALRSFLPSLVTSSPVSPNTVTSSLFWLSIHVFPLIVRGQLSESHKQ
jgi:hypothetical protein